MVKKYAVYMMEGKSAVKSILANGECWELAGDYKAHQCETYYGHTIERRKVSNRKRLSKKVGGREDVGLQCC